MRNINCRNIRREIEEAGSADLLSVAAISHLETCAACETLSRQQTNLQAIVSRLGTVEAPGDFDFRLRARLANDKRGTARPFRMSDFSFGLRSVAVAAILLLLGSAIVFVSFRTRPDNSVAGGKVAPQPGTTLPPTDPIAVPVDVKPDGNQVVKGSKKNESADGTPKRRFRSEAATYRDSNRVRTQDQSGTRAPVLRREDQLAESYPTAAFPINASYQSLKVSVDDARGTSRTISLPSVSFGSQRTLSQNASPLVAAARGAW